MNKKGFTLLELLIALAVVGILATLGFSSFLGAQRRAQLSEATAQFASDLQRARSEAQRHNRNASLALNDDSSYILTLDGNATIRTLPHGAQVEVVSGADTVTYNAPYGEVDAPDRRFAISSARIDEVRYVRIIGVTGKVINQ